MPCRDCEFWRAIDGLVTPEAEGARQVGVCRRFPPHIRQGDDRTAIWRQAAFPVTTDDEWCGEFLDEYMARD